MKIYPRNRGSGIQFFYRQRHGFLISIEHDVRPRLLYTWPLLNLREQPFERGSVPRPRFHEMGTIARDSMNLHDLRVFFSSA